MKLSERRKKIIETYTALRAEQPFTKKYSLIQRVAIKTGYVLDRQNHNSSYVMKVVRELGK